MNCAVFLFCHHVLLSFALHNGIHHQGIFHINSIAVPACLLALFTPFDSVFGSISAVTFVCSLCIGARRDFAVWFRLIFHCCLWQETLFGSLSVLSALPSEEEDLRGLDRSGNVALVVKVRFAGDASE